MARPRAAPHPPPPVTKNYSPSQSLSLPIAFPFLHPRTPEVSVVLVNVANPTNGSCRGVSLSVTHPSLKTGRVDTRVGRITLETVSLYTKCSWHKKYSKSLKKKNFVPTVVILPWKKKSIQGRLHGDLYRGPFWKFSSKKKRGGEEVFIHSLLWRTEPILFFNIVK